MWTRILQWAWTWINISNRLGDFCHAMVSRHLRKKIVAEKLWAFSYFGFMISVLGNIRIFRTINSLSRVD